MLQDLACRRVFFAKREHIRIRLDLLNVSYARRANSGNWVGMQCAKSAAPDGFKTSRVNLLVIHAPQALTPLPLVLFYVNSV